VSKTRLLKGLRVVDLADEKGELCGRLLADLGAEVIRVEPPGGARSRALPAFHAGRSLYFAYRNTNKRGMMLDLGDPGDRDELHRQIGFWWDESGRKPLSRIDLLVQRGRTLSVSTVRSVRRPGRIRGAGP